MATSASGAVSSRQTQRIERDLNGFDEKSLAFIRKLERSVNDGVNQLTGIMIGPDNTPYAGGHFRFLILFPPEYPFKPPEFYFKTGICHPNVQSADGRACHDLLNATWAPSISLKTFFTEMHALLEKPNYDTPVEADSVKEKTAEKARMWTQEFAQPSGDD